MVKLSIVAIILAFVDPSIQSILIKNRIVAQINETSCLIKYARHHAIDEQALVVVCPSADFSNCSTNWNDAKIGFIDDNNNAIRGGAEELLVTITASPATSIMTNTSNIIKFVESDKANFATKLLLWHKNGDGRYARSLFETLQERVKMSSDSHRNGINKNAIGTVLSYLEMQINFAIN